ncbi:hypothetical protein EOB59_24590 [Mesorhizobium sp. M7A.F.Ca.MR.176.00.0.0]|uniref:hypothetical protein n=1 Tax=Mesorhizobium sp. M7A.F.Ca.MR.176.00.0.0 TaxID=2496776 RepID=UPI000FD1BF78|nr:hypothetical protein [Mesorhizobium sp. M7A.F.Ca.MR.176.00.0.0]RUU87742.1 hypothetical protein EOB59_24590 [Mesorhizobium sp. M7A.F.Ca.MR.176.00.0.0]
MMSYASAETILARMFSLGDDVQAKAFRGRLKHLKRLGVPLGSHPGTGKKIWYHDEQVYQWAFCLELAEFGIDPTAVVSFIRENWPDIFTHFQEAPKGAGRDELCFYSVPALMSATLTEGDGIPYSWKTTGSIRLNGTRRALIINLSAMVREIDILRVGADSTGGDDDAR